MTFIISGATFRSFATYQDVVDRDQRLFEANEGLDDATVEDMLIRTSQRILSKIRATDWWRDYQFKRNPGLNNDVRRVPEVNALLIKSRQNDFTDLCVYQAMEEYILPKVADFGNEASAERQKILFYTEKNSALFRELIEAGDWYDFDGDNVIETTEKQPVKLNLVRIR
ncbi:hypothetical protein [Brevundimonas sp.]|jgi:hypothetical protein|uniref:hypothetical protein n=1 Tax=Brevundimonas sp. TaxID=1871086 RepID=UPI003783259D